MGIIKERAVLSQFTSKLFGEFRRHLTLRWTGPYLLIPIFFVVSLIVETWMQESGIIAYIPVGSRSDLSLWRILMISVMVGTPLSAIFMAESWKKKFPSDDFSGSLLSTQVSSFLILLVIMTAASFIVTAPFGVSLSDKIGSVAARALIMCFWSTAIATLCSVISGGAGAAILSIGLFSIALFPGLSGTAMSRWFAAPLGNLVTGGTDLLTVLAVLGHSAVYLILSALMLRKISRR